MTLEPATFPRSTSSMPDTPPRKHKYGSSGQFRSIPTRQSDSRLLFASAEKKDQ